MAEQRKRGLRDYFGIQAAARYLGVSIATMRRMDKKGLLVPHRTPGGHRRYTPQMLDNYIGKIASAGAGEAALQQTALDVASKMELSELLETITAENTLLKKQERRERETANALREAAKIIGRSLDLNQVLVLLLEQLEKLVPLDGSAVLLWEDNSLQVIAMHGFPPDITRQDINRGITQNQTWQTIMKKKEPLIVSDARDCLYWEECPELRRFRSWIGVPIVTHDWVWGILTLHKAEPGMFGPREADLATTIAHYAAAAIESAQLSASTLHLSQTHQARVAQLASLQITSLRLSATFELESVLQTLAEGALELTPAEDTHIYFYDKQTDQLSFGTALWRDGRRDPAVLMPRPDGLTATVARQGKALLIDNARSHPLYSDKVSSRWGVHAVAGFPLKRQERVIGVFNVTYLSPHRFRPEEVRILNLLADQAAVAIENARLYQQVHAHSEELEVEVAARTLQLRQEKERADAILIHAADGIMLTDAQGSIEYVNPSWERLTGYSTEQALGQNPGIQKGGETPPEVYQEMWQSITVGKVWRGQLRDRRADGTFYDVDLTIAPVMNADHKIVNFVGVHRDISALKDVARLKDEFVSNVSHELRTPIANLKLYQNLLEQGRPERREAYLEVLNRETVRLEQLVTDLLDISRLDRGAISLAPELVNLNGLAADVVHRLLKLAEQREVTLELIQAPQLPSAWLDLHQMTQVLTNLIVNALNYTEAGGQVVVETARKTLDRQPGISLTVQDTGIGIAPADQEHIFERFFRAQDAREIGVPGTGLGLSIAKRIVDLHNGTIQVESTLGQGSTFGIWLPLS